MSGNFLSCSKGVKDPLDVPEFKCDYPLVASAEMGLISPGGENLLYLVSAVFTSCHLGSPREGSFSPPPT